MGRGRAPAREISFVSLVAYGPKASLSALAMGGHSLRKQQGSFQQGSSKSLPNLNRICMLPPVITWEKVELLRRGLLGEWSREEATREHLWNKQLHVDWRVQKEEFGCPAPPPSAPDTVGMGWVGITFLSRIPLFSEKDV